MQIIDFHTHIYPDAIAHKAAQSIRDFYNVGDGKLDGTVDLLLKCCQDAGITRCVVLPVALRPDRVSAINNFIVEEVHQFPQFTGFGTVHAAMDGLTDEAQRIIELGLRGIKMHPDTQGFPIDDPLLYPLYDMVQDKLPLLFHMGDCRYDFSHPARLRNVLDQFPKLQVIAAHYGGYSMYETAFEYLNDKDCFFDISSSIMFMENGVAEKYINKYGAERMLFGSDFPLWDPRNEVRTFLDLHLTLDQKEQIAYKNALHILKEA